MNHAPQQCIFCKSTSAAFAAVEHIVPESLGNREHILPRGVVCDPCNNYFATKVEGPILTSDFFRQARHRNGIPSKRDRVPMQVAMSFPYGMPLEMGVARDGTRYIGPAVESHSRAFSALLHERARLTAVFPVAAKPDANLFGRFLLKMGLEALAARMLPVEGGIKAEHIENKLLDEARLFARFGRGPAAWPYHEVRIYREGQQFLDRTDSYDILHEYTFLYTEERELYFVVAIFGIQHTINLGGPVVDGFHRWLASHGDESPLYRSGK